MDAPSLQYAFAELAAYSDTMTLSPSASEAVVIHENCFDNHMLQNVWKSNSLFLPPGAQVISPRASIVSLDVDCCVRA